MYGKRFVLEQKLLLTAYKGAYEKSIATRMNDLDLCLKVVKVMSTNCVTLATEYLGNRYRDRCLVLKDHQWEMPYGNRMVT